MLDFNQFQQGRSSVFACVIMLTLICVYESACDA